MSKKISQLVQETDIQVGDLFTFARGIDNFSCELADMLYSTGGLEDVLIGSGDQSIGFAPAFGMQISYGPLGGGVSFDGDTVMTFDGTTDAVLLNARPGKPLEVGGNGGTIVFSATGGILLNPNAGNVVTINWVSTLPANWAGTPVTMNAAIERLGAAVAGLLGGPIP